MPEFGQPFDGFGEPLVDAVEWTVAALPQEASAARRQTVHALRNWGLEGLIEDCVLVTSELVTNAITEVRSAEACSDKIILRLELRSSSMALEVWDGSSRLPHTRVAQDDDEGGRGLPMVAEFCHEWGAYRVHAKPGKTVWAMWQIKT